MWTQGVILDERRGITMEEMKRDKEIEKQPPSLVPEQTKNARQEDAGRGNQENE